MNMKNLTKFALLFLSIFTFQSVNAQGPGHISGYVRCANSQPMENVKIIISGGSFTEDIYTDAQGYYEINNLALGFYTVTPEYDDQNLNGISTFDLVLAYQMIFNISPPDPWQFLAADMNASGTVTTADLLEMRLIILNLNQPCTGSSCWLFGSSDFNPSSGTGSLNNIVADATEGQMNVNFVGVKKGDLNFNACPN